MKFLQEMKVLTDYLLKEKYDITRVQQLDEMIGDWIRELNAKK